MDVAVDLSRPHPFAHDIDPENGALSQKHSVRPDGKITLVVRIRQAMREAAADPKVLKEEGALVLAWRVTHGATPRRGF